MDMLVKLYDLPPYESTLLLKKKLAALGVEIRSALAPEKHAVLQWVNQNFNYRWGSEVEKSFSNQPITCFIAVRNRKIIGFACYESTSKGFFGPTGVQAEERGKGLGKILLLESLWGLQQLGYAYGIIGGVGPCDFYSKTVGATIIEGSTPGLYQGMIT